MGSAFGSFFPPEAGKREGTTLCELRINHLQAAHDIIGQRPQGDYTPVVLVPNDSHTKCCCCVPCCYVSIPHGFSAIVTKFGAQIPGDGKDGTWSPGFHWLSPFMQVERLVSRQTIIFDTPSKGIKSRDNINVEIDVMMAFEVEDAVKFVYKGGGPDKLDVDLRSAQAEALRAMINETLIDKVYDLHGRGAAQDAIALINKKTVEVFGVRVTHFTVKEVKMPGPMAKDKEEQTLFRKKEHESIARTKADVQRITVEEGKQKLREECDNNKMVGEQQAEVSKTQATRETKQVVAQTEKDIAELEAGQANTVQQVKVQFDLECSKVESAIKTIEREMKAKTVAEVGRINADAIAMEKQKLAEAAIEVAEKLANGKRAVGEAEGEASQAFVARRAFEADMQRLHILEKVVLNKDVKIASAQENVTSLNEDNAVVAQMAQQGMEAMRAKLAELTATSLAKLEQQPRQAIMS